MNVYSSKATVKARQITKPEGENVVGPAGPAFASKGQYVTEQGDVIDAEAFESQWTRKTAPKKSPAKKTAKAPAKKTTDTDAAAKVAAAREAKNG